MPLENRWFRWTVPFATSNKNRAGIRNFANPINVAALKRGFHLVQYDSCPTGKVFITDDGYLIFNYQVVKDATKVRLLTGAGLIVPRWFRWMRPMIWLC